MTRTERIAAAAAILLVGLAALGCSESKRYVPVYTTDQAGSWQETPGKVRVFVPEFLGVPSADALKREAFAEIDAQPVPVTIAVTIREPGPYVVPLWVSPSGLVWGQTDMHSWLHVAWRGGGASGGRPLLPGLQHEMDHVRTQDPNYGH